MRRTKKFDKTLFFMILPGFIFMIVFNYIPMYGLYISFTQGYQAGDTILSAQLAGDYGFANFVYFLTDPFFWQVMKNTIIISFGTLLIGFPLGIILALMINELTNLRFKKSFQTISYLPYFLSWVILGGMIITWLSETGIVNSALMSIGLTDEPILFMTTPEYYKPIAILSDVWKNLGWSTILYLAAMTGIDPGLYEAATIDGAGKLKQIWHITLPGIKMIIALNLVLSAGMLLASNLDQTLILQNNLNISTSEVIDSYVLKVGLGNGDYSYATAIGLFRSIITIALVLMTNQIAKKISDRSIF